MSDETLNLCDKCALALSSHWCMSPALCDCDEPQTVVTNRSRRFFRWWMWKDVEYGVHESFRHHSIERLQRSALSCYLCFLLLEQVKDSLDKSREDRPWCNTLVGYASIAPGRDDDFYELVMFYQEGNGARTEISSRYNLAAVLSLKPFLGPSIALTQSHQTLQMSPADRYGAQIRAWTTDCERCHSECHQRNCFGGFRVDNLPTRLLRLTTKDNKKVLQQGIPSSSLPQKFQDAISVCLAIGVHYLWIDSLCIIQDCQDDWNYEAPRMCSIYSNAWLNIAATFAKDAHDGLFCNTKYLSQPLVAASWTGNSMVSRNYVLANDRAWSDRVEKAPLNSRAWVLQERILSPRTVHFACDQMWWSCTNLPSACEQSPTGADLDPNSIGYKSMILCKTDSESPLDWHWSWLDLVTNYTKAGISYESDRPAAISGIAEATARVHGIETCDYLAGLWRPRLLHSLLWRCEFFATSDEYKFEKLSSPRVAGVPTWSWLSITAPVFVYASPNSHLSCVRLIDARTHPITSPFGRVNGGHVTITGPLIPFRRSTDPQRYPDDDITLGAMTLHYPREENLVILDEELESTRVLAGRDKFPCWSWPEIGINMYFACIGTFPAFGNDLRVKCELEGLLLARSTGHDRNEVGHTRMASLRLQFTEDWEGRLNSEDGKDPLSKYVEVYTIY